MLREWASSARDTHLVPERGGGFCVLLRSAARRVEDVVVVHPSVPPAHVRAERRVVANVLHLWRHSWVDAASEHTWRGGTIARPWAPIHGVDGKTDWPRERSVREACMGSAGHTEGGDVPSSRCAHRLEVLDRQRAARVLRAALHQMHLHVYTCTRAAAVAVAVWRRRRRPQAC